jgi:ferredoxin
MSKTRIILDFQADSTEKPITCHLVRDYGLSVNILRAKIEPDQAGRLLMEVEAPRDALEKALEFLAEEGIGVRFMEKELRVDKEACVNCGACTAVCGSGALAIGAPEWELVFNAERCVACELCVEACPVRVISVNF